MNSSRPRCGVLYDAGTWSKEVHDERGTHWEWEEKMEPCSKPLGHVEVRSDGSQKQEHGKASTGSHGRVCACECHEEKYFGGPWKDSCEDCWRTHIPLDGCPVCAQAIKDWGKDPTDGQWYLTLVFRGGYPAFAPPDHQHWSVADLQETWPDGRGPVFTVA